MVAARGFPVSPLGVGFTGFVSSGLIIDATNEYAAVVGRVYWEDGLSHTISAAGGGSIVWAALGTPTLAGGSVLRVAPVDVSGAGFPSPLPVAGCFGEVPTGVPIASPVTTVMTSGSKSYAHTQNAAVVVEFTTRTGTDSVSVQNLSGLHAGYPCRVHNGAKGSAFLPVMLIADDGVRGFILGAPPPFYSPGWFTVVVGAAAAQTFRVAVPTRIHHLGAAIGSVNGGAVFDLRLATNIFAGPVYERQASWSQAQGHAVTSAAGVGYTDVIIDPVTLVPGIDYAIVVDNVGTDPIIVGGALWLHPDARSRSPFGASTQVAERSAGSALFVPGISGYSGAQAFLSAMHTISHQPSGI